MNNKLFFLILLLAPFILGLAAVSIPFIFLYMIFEKVWDSFKKDKKVEESNKVPFLMSDTRLFKDAN